MPFGPRPTWLTPFSQALGAILALALASTPCVSAQWRTTQDAEFCVAGTGVRSLNIAVCGRALGRGDLSDPDRASVLIARGKAYRDAGQLAAALADFDAALTHNPYSASALYERALALDGSGHYEQALEDFGRTLALSPRFAAAYKNRGVAHFYAGNLTCAHFDLDTAAALARHDAEIYAFRGYLHYLAGRHQDAVDDFRRVHALGLPYPYLPLWRYLTRIGNGDPARALLLAARRDLLPGEWPEPLLEAYLGERDPATLIAALEDDDRAPGNRRLGASHYYLAVLERLNGKQKQALLHLRQTLALAEPRSPERVLAEHALTPATARRSSKQPGGC
jgi:lipoprotein NlpI